MSPTALAHPFDLPEIRGHIALFLNRHDLAICSSLSRAWSQTCLPLLWRTLALSPTHSYPAVKLRRAFLVRHSHFVKDLACDNLYGYEHLSAPFSSFFSEINCQNLESLTLIGHVNDRANLVYRHGLTLLHLNFSTITGNKTLEGSDELWRAFASCRSLESLSISKLHVSHNNWPICWSLWSRLTCLRLLEIKFSSNTHAAGGSNGVGDTSLQLQQQPLRPSGLFELLAQEDPSQPTRLKTLELHLLQGIERLEDHLALLKFCPLLETFVWFVNPEPFTGKQLGRQLEEQVRYCPQLSNVTLGIDYRNEDILVRYLESGASLSVQELNLPRAQFDMDTWFRFREHHWSIVRTLDVSSFADGMALQDMLCRMTGLESFIGYMIQSKDMVRDPRPWVCLGLKSMKIAIEISKEDVNGSQKVAMERLGTLTRLQQLELNPIYNQFSLKFQLAGFLESLATWRDFQTLIFQHVPQELTENDVRWMTENWPRLHSVIGEMQLEASLKKILTDKGVQLKLASTNVCIS